MWRYRRTILYFISIPVLILTAQACKTETDTTQQPNDDSFELKSIRFLDQQIFLPKNYSKVNLAEVREMVRQNPDLKSMDRQYYDILMKANDSYGPPEIFLESENKFHAILFIPEAYVPLGRELVSPYVNLLETNFLNNEHTYTRLESKFITLQRAKAIKVKYEQHFPTGKLYLTQYVITYGVKTFSMFVLNTTTEDLRIVLNNFSK